jgi:hypothetical protein
MPKVMMIGKVSKLGRRTRKAGSFKGMLGTVVLEGSRAQSRRYGMGNIAGSPEEHGRAVREAGPKFIAAYDAVRTATTCDARMTNFKKLLIAYGGISAHLHSGSTERSPTSGPQADRMIAIATDSVRDCYARRELPFETGSGVSGARRRRRR